MISSDFRRAALRCGASALALSAMIGAAQAGQLTGRVTAAGAPLEGAVVRVAETGATAATAADGRYRFADLPAGDYTLITTYVGAPQQSAMVAVPQTGTVQQDVAMGAGDADVMDSVIVRGQRGSLFASLNRQRAADNLISALSADAIGRLPDQNVAETARRLPGVSIEPDQGEGRYVVIRGIDPALNAVSVNGVRVPSPEADTRAAALDVVDADILDSVIITKSLLPDMDGDGIGGSIEIETASGFDYDGRLIKGQVRGNYTNKNEDLGEKVSLSIADQFAQGRAAFAGSVSWNARRFATDNKEVDGGWSDEDAGDGDIFFPDEFELREYNVTRERLSASLNFDFRPSDNTDLYVRGLFNDFRDQEYRQRIEVPFEDGDFVDASSSAAAGQAFFTGDVGMQRDLKDREETQRIWQIQAGGETRADLWTFEYFGAFTHGEEEEPLAIDGITFEADAEDDAPAGYLIGVDVSNPLFPNLLYGNQAGRDFFTDPVNFGFDGLEIVDGLTEDDEWSFGADIRRDVRWGDAPGYVKFGGKGRLREKMYDGNVTVYGDYTPGGLTMSPFEATTNYPIDDIGPVVSRDFRSFFEANQGDFEVDAVDTLIANNVEDYVANEDIYALYAMASGDFGPVRLVGGLRWETTDFESTAGDVRLYEEYEDAPPIPTIGESGGLPGSAVCYDGDGDALSVDASSPVDQDILCVGERTGAKDYDDFLPSAVARWEASDSLVVRASYYRSVARPNIGQVVPAVEFEQDDEGEREAFIGNPDLNRQIADNFDASVEWYFNAGGVLSGGVFHKSVADYIATQIFEDVDYFGVTFDEVETAVNLDDATITGIELNYQQALTFLPGLLDGLLVGANYTYVDSEGELANGRTIPLPKTSKHIVGGLLGYDRDGWDIRLTAQYRDDYLDEINTGGDGVDRYMDSHLQWDFRAQYDVTENLTVFGDVTNINDEPAVFYLKDGENRFLSQYEEYGWSAAFGVKFQY